MKSWTPKLPAEPDAEVSDLFELLTSGLPPLPATPLTLFVMPLVLLKAGVLARL